MKQCNDNIIQKLLLISINLTQVMNTGILEYCSLVWAGAANFYFDMLDKIQKLVRLLLLLLLPLLNPRLIVELQSGQVYFIVITQLDVHLNQLNLFHFLILVAGSLAILTGCMIFFSIPRWYQDVYVNRFSLHAVTRQNSVSAECSPLMYDLHGVKTRVNRHLLSLGSY